jgi:hypothetical protein
MIYRHITEHQRARLDRFRRESRERAATSARLAARADALLDEYDRLQTCQAWGCSAPATEAGNWHSCDAHQLRDVF